MATTTIGSGEIFDANLNAQAAIQRVKMAQRTNAVFPINFADFRVWDAIATNLPGTSATDDLGLYGGTYATSPPYVGTSDMKALGSVSRYARVLVVVPHDFEGNSQSLTFRAYAGMVTTIADVACTLDVECWRIDRDGTLGSADLVTTSATTINSLTAAAKDFQLADTSTISAGDLLDVRLTVLVNDAATATAVIAAIWDFLLLADLR